MNYPLHDLLEKAAANGDLTRAGVRGAVDGLEVDFRGASPNVTYGQDAGSLTHEMMIFQPDEDAEMGTSSVSDFYGGTTFDEIEFTSACSAA